MRKFYLVLVSAAFGILNVHSVSAAIEGEGPYFHVDGGVAWLQDFDANIADLPGRLHLDPGFRLSIGPGYTLYSSSSFEAAVQFETGFIYNKLNRFDSIDYGPLSARGEYWQIPFLADILYTFKIGPVVVPYIGVGGGGVYGRMSVDSLDDQPIGGRNSETDGAFQAMAGVRFRLDEQNELGVGYKFLATFPEGVDYIGTHSISLVYVLRF